MQLTDLDIRNIYEASASLGSRKLPFKLSYRINKIADQLETSYKATERARVDLIKTFEDTEGENKGKVPQEKVNDFYEKFNEMLLENTADYGNIAKIPMSLLEETELEVGIVRAFMKIIDENA